MEAKKGREIIAMPYGGMRHLARVCGMSQPALRRALRYETNGLAAQKVRCAAMKVGGYKCWVVEVEKERLEGLKA